MKSYNTNNSILKQRLTKLRRKFSKGDLGEVLRGGTIAFIYRLITMGVSYLLLYYIATELGEEGVGIYNLCLAILGILIMVACMGFNTSVVRYASQYNTRSWDLSLKNLYKSILTLIVPFSIVLGVLLILSARILAEQAYNDPELFLPLIVVGLTLPFAAIATVNVEFIRGLKKVHISELFRNLSLQLITLILLFIASFYSIDKLYPVLFYGFGFVVSVLYTSFYIVRILKKQFSKTQRVDDEPMFNLKEVFIVSLPMILTSFIQLINGKVDIIMIGLFESTAVIGVFGTAFKLSIITNFAIGALKTIAMPKISELFWQDRMDDLNVLIQESTKFIFYFSAPICILLLIFPEFILGILGEGFVKGATTLRIFAVTQLLNSACGLVAVFLNMTGNQVYFTKLVAVSTVLNVILNLVLIPIYGMEGAAWASLASVALWNIVGAFYIYRRYGIMTFVNPLTLFKVSK